jgi:hypothetical protein
MEEILNRFVEDMIPRVTGPLHFRLLLQPGIAIFLAIRPGLADARANKPAYFWTMVKTPGNRVAMIKDGWRDVGKVFILALTLDAAFQLYVLGMIYPGEAVFVALILAVLPYLVMRGATMRIVDTR